MPFLLLFKGFFQDKDVCTSLYSLQAEVKDMGQGGGKKRGGRWEGVGAEWMARQTKKQGRVKAV